MVCVSEAEGIYVRCDLGNQRLAFNVLVSRQRQVHPKSKQERLRHRSNVEDLKHMPTIESLNLVHLFLLYSNKLSPARGRQRALTISLCLSYSHTYKIHKTGNTMHKSAPQHTPWRWTLLLYSTPVK